MKLLLAHIIQAHAIMGIHLAISLKVPQNACIFTLISCTLGIPVAQSFGCQYGEYPWNGKWFFRQKLAYTPNITWSRNISLSDISQSSNHRYSDLSLFFNDIVHKKRNKMSNDNVRTNVMLCYNGDVEKRFG